MKKIIILLSIACLSFTSEKSQAVHIFMIRDSTMRNKPDEDIPWYDWGRVLQYLFTDLVVVDNHARKGSSSENFITEGRQESVVSRVEKGDYVIIQFRPNDEKPNSTRHPDPFTTNKQNLRNVVDETQEKK